jgi:hypothetical protein
MGGRIARLGPGAGVVPEGPTVLGLLDRDSKPKIRDPTGDVNVLTALVQGLLALKTF